MITEMAGLHKNQKLEEGKPSPGRKKFMVGGGVRTAEWSHR